MWLSNSSVGRKVVMSVTGIALVLFLTFHMAMNLVALVSANGYNMVCEFLGANWYALVATVGLAALFIIHIIYAFWLTMQNRKAQDCGMGFSKHARTGYHRNRRSGPAPGKLLGKNAASRVDAQHGYANRCCHTGICSQWCSSH